MPGTRRRKRSRPRRLVWWLAGAAAAVVILAVGGTFLYIHVISGPAPAPLTLKPASGSSSPASPGDSAASSVSGTWKITTGSVVGYRVKEVLVGQSQTAVGRTSAITGDVTISGTTVTAAGFTVQMATIKSNESERDVQFRGRIMDTSTYPTGTLTLTKPIALGALPAVGVVKTYTATAKPHPARANPARDVPAVGRAHIGRDRSVGIDTGAVLAVGHPKPELHRVRDHPEPRRARVPAEARPLLIRSGVGGGVRARAEARAPGQGWGRRTAAHGS